jgi:hypothetical protein
MGLLLDKHEIVKEDYMESAPYLIGQLLKVSDDIHIQYCKVVRKGEIPPQLAGNSVYSLASENPIPALAQLCQRMKPYLSWASSYSRQNVTDSENPSGLVRWNLGLCQDICDKLKERFPLPAHFDENEKAEFLIGYLASFPKREKGEDGVKETVEIDEEGTNNA